MVAKSAILFMIGGSCLVGVYYADLADWQEALMVLVAIVILVAGSIILLDAVICAFTNHLQDVREAMSITPVSRLAMSLHGLDANQCAILQRSSLEINAIVGSPAPVYFVKCPGLDVPWLWIVDYLEEIAKTWPLMPAIRNHNDGTHDREYARAFTALLVAQGMAQPAAGNKPAELSVSMDDLYARLGAGD